MMAGQLANEGEALALNLLFRNAATPPTGIYLGLATAAIADTDTLADITEENDANYARQAINFTAPTQVGGKGTIDNDADIQFGPWDVDADVAITHAFLTDASSGTTGNLITYFTLPESKSPAAGETLTVPLGDCIFDID